MFPAIRYLNTDYSGCGHNCTLISLDVRQLEFMMAELRHSIPCILSAFVLSFYEDFSLRFELLCLYFHSTIHPTTQHLGCKQMTDSTDLICGFLPKPLLTCDHAQGHSLCCLMQVIVLYSHNIGQRFCKFHHSRVECHCV